MATEGAVRETNKSNKR